ncbi:hypothetical protein T439DRAFT_331598 [Meredithblackwellia eburnea MCA 4105]
MRVQDVLFDSRAGAGNVFAAAHLGFAIGALAQAGSGSALQLLSRMEKPATILKLEGRKTATTPPCKLEPALSLAQIRLPKHRSYSDGIMIEDIATLTPQNPLKACN